MVERKKIRSAQVPSIGLGTWRLSGEECVDAVETALSIGYRHIDTAQMYGNEREVGRGISNSGVDRREVFLVTKLSTGNFTREKALSSGRESVKRLGTDYVDLLLMHWPNPSVPLGETLGAMRELQEEEAVKYIGVSNFPAPMVGEAAQYAEIFCNQVEHHPYRKQDEFVHQAVEMDYLLTAYSPVAKGRITHDATLAEIAESHGKTAAQVALRWLVQQENVAAIPKAQSREHQESNLDVFDFELAGEEMEHISGLSR